MIKNGCILDQYFYEKLPISIFKKLHFHTKWRRTKKFYEEEISGQSVIMLIRLVNMEIKMLFGNILKIKEKKKGIKKSTVNSSSYGID